MGDISESCLTCRGEQFLFLYETPLGNQHTGNFSHSTRSIARTQKDFCSFPNIECLPFFQRLLPRFLVAQCQFSFSSLLEHLNLVWDSKVLRWNPILSFGNKRGACDTISGQRDIKRSHWVGFSGMFHRETQLETLCPSPLVLSLALIMDMEVRAPTILFQPWNITKSISASKFLKQCQCNLSVDLLARVSVWEFSVMYDQHKF